MQTQLPPPFNDHAVREQLDQVLVRYGVDDRITHAVIASLANVLAPHLK